MLGRSSLAVTGVLALALACGAPDRRDSPPPPPGPIVQGQGYLLVSSFQYPSYWTPVDVQGVAGMEPLACADPNFLPTVTWENLTSGDSGSADVRPQYNYLEACEPYGWSAFVPVATRGTHTIRLRGYYADGRQFDEELIDLVRLAPGDPWPPPP